tara:strand:- start:155 stop:475 length:321 start_codon:yes stop_codon:yes gene_type:complete
MIYITKDIGCYFDGAFGFEFNAGRVIDLAIEHGYTPHYQAENDEDLDALVHEIDDAEEYLNENTTTPENTYWSWVDGDFGLWMYCEEHPDEPMNPDEPCPCCEVTE